MLYRIICLVVVVFLGCIEKTAQTDPDRRNTVENSVAGSPVPIAEADGAPPVHDAQIQGGMMVAPTTGGVTAMEADFAGGTISSAGTANPDASAGQTADRLPPDEDTQSGGTPALPAPRPRRSLTPELNCDTLDNDQDGFIDEGVSNLCGGCGEIPPTGCRLWGIELTHLFPGDLPPGIIASPILASLGQSVFDVPNGRCQLQRVVLTVDADEHLGELTISSAEVSLQSRPEYDERLNRPVYRTPEDWGLAPFFEPGEIVRVQASGQPPFEAFDTELVAPAHMEGVSENDLRVFAENTQRFGPGGRAQLRWISAGADGRPLSLFYGGSRLVFRQTVSYQAIEFFTLAANLVDDGLFSLPFELLGQGAPSTAYRISVRRGIASSLVFGPHRVSMNLGEIVSARDTETDGTAMADFPPFQITSPDPNRPAVIPGRAMRVAWSDMPPGTGPLEVRLNVRDPASNQQHLLICIVEDHRLGFMDIPAEHTEVLSDNAASINKLSLYWRIMAQGVAEPDVGDYTHAMSVLLDLDVQSQ
ncbi:MAG: hypothetical protein VX589_06000 [Myxococcota bacterium]|nr:hypothetical protein [Myxococcota bacterium]